jgi:hypothetical protein
MAVRSYGEDEGRDVVLRGPALYDRDNRTYRFTGVVKTQITIALTLEELPEPARRYIALKAARVFQNRVEGREDESDMRDEMQAMAILMADELRSEGNNALTDNWTATGTIRRHPFGYIER